MVKVKGISRRIVEIKGGYGSCFERAIFFVRQDIPRDTSEKTLTQEAARIIDEFCAQIESPRASVSQRLLRILRVAGPCALGACSVLVCRAFGWL